jgi:hypothetical protein
MHNACKFIFGMHTAFQFRCRHIKHRQKVHHTVHTKTKMEFLVLYGDESDASVDLDALSVADKEKKNLNPEIFASKNVKRIKGSRIRMSAETKHKIVAVYVDYAHRFIAKNGLH